MPHFKNRPKAMSIVQSLLLIKIYTKLRRTTQYFVCVYVSHMKWSGSLSFSLIAQHTGLCMQSRAFDTNNNQIQIKIEHYYQRSVLHNAHTYEHMFLDLQSTFAYVICCCLVRNRPPRPHSDSTFSIVIRSRRSKPNCVIVRHDNN